MSNFLEIIVITVIISHLLYLIILLTTVYVADSLTKIMIKIQYFSNLMRKKGVK